MSENFIEEVKKRIKEVLPKVDREATLHKCTGHAFMKDTMMVVLAKGNDEFSVPVDRETWETTGCGTDEKAIMKFLDSVLNRRI